MLLREKHLENNVLYAIFYKIKKLIQVMEQNSDVQQ